MDFVTLTLKKNEKEKKTTQLNGMHYVIKFFKR